MFNSTVYSATMLLAFPNKTKLPLVYMIVEVCAID